MDAVATEVPTIPGTSFAGGFYAGRILIDGVQHALIVSPQADGDHDGVVLNEKLDNVDGALSFYDGRANTAALAEAGSELAKWAQGLRIGDFDDWYIPARDELEICYRAFKPDTEENYCGSGDNPSSVPMGYAYARTSPAQTTVEAFKEDGPEAFDSGDWYWSSTQCAGNEAYAWCQDFDYGYQDYHHKVNEYRARAVRRVKI